ncbi:MAG: alpha/beta fold hydrolase, partial [Rhodospirillaceae bacterium]|nr:alpha/beta fold hydrolase [Rhodospirillaceae bacterium]
NRRSASFRVIALAPLAGLGVARAFTEGAARGARPALVGYCMGGLLALVVAQMSPKELAGLAVLATPWDFHAERPEQARALADLTGAWLSALEPLQQFSVDALQALFAANDPLVAFRKFRAFAGLDQDSDAALRFVALEDWLNDGIPLPLPIARQTLQEWYGDNLTAAGRWTVGGLTIRPEEIDLPALALIPDKDRIVPQESAMALARLLPQAEIRIARAGHIGMMAGRRAERETWRPLLAWQQSLAA